MQHHIQIVVLATLGVASCTTVEQPGAVAPLGSATSTRVAGGGEPRAQE